MAKRSPFALAYKALAKHLSESEHLHSAVIDHVLGTPAGLKFLYNLVAAQPLSYQTFLLHVPPDQMTSMPKTMWKPIWFAKFEHYVITTLYKRAQRRVTRKLLKEALRRIK